MKSARNGHVDSRRRREGYADARTPPQGDAGARTPPKEREGYEVVPPRAPPSRVEGPGRPNLRDGALRDGALREGAPNDGSLRDPADGFAQAEFDLLGSKGVVRSPEGQWYHSEKYPDGRTMITPVNSRVELRRLSDVRANGTVIN